MKSSRDLASNDSSQVLSEIFCPPIHTWILGEKTAFKITAVTTIIICPVAILLNILVIMIVKKRRELGNNKSNILLASLAVADVLIGAVSMPLTITLDVLVLIKFLNASTFCSIAFVNDIVLYIGSCSAVYHLTVIAWERCVAIEKWMDYKVIVTRDRVKRYARIAWILAVLSSIPPSIMKIAGVQYKYLLVVDIICVVPGASCILLIGYFYIRAYFGVRRQELDKIREVRSLIKAKTATKVGKRTAILTGVVLISFVPSMVFLFFREVFPALRRSSFFRWSMMLAKLNSFFDPVLYCYRDCRFRNAMLEMLRIKKRSPRIKQSGSVQSLKGALEIPCVPRSRSCHALANLRDTAHLSLDTEDLALGRRLSAPPRHATDTGIQLQVDVHQPKISATEPRIQTESGVIRQGSPSHHEDTRDQPEASRRLQSPHPQVGLSLHSPGLQPACTQWSPKVSQVDVNQRTIIATERRIQTESGVTRQGDQSHHEDTSDQPEASRRLKSPHPQGGSRLHSPGLQPCHTQWSHKVVQVDVHQPKIIVTEPRIQTESSVTRQGSQGCHEDTSEQPEARSRPQKSPHPQAGSSLHSPGLQPAHIQWSHKVVQVATEPRIQTESGVTTRRGQSCLEDSSDQPEASRPQKSLQPQTDSSIHFPGLQPARGSPQNHVREMIRSKSLNEHEFVGVIIQKQNCQQEAMRRPKTSLPTASRTITSPSREFRRLTSKL